MRQGGMISSKAIEDIITEISSKIKAQVPVFVSELRIQAHEYLRHRTFSSERLVRLSDFAIVVPIHHGILYRISLFIIHLLIKIKSGRCMTHLMILDSRTCGKRCIASCNTRIVRIIVRGELGDTALVPSEVITQVPTEVRCLNGNGIHIKLQALILHPSDIGQNDVREIGSCRSTDVVQQVLRTLIIIL